MSEELERGILKPILIGYEKHTEEERKKYRELSRQMLIKRGVIKEDSVLIPID